MKKAVIAALYLSLGATNSAAQMVGSVHDFTSTGVDIPVEQGTGQICIVCHTPHDADPAVVGAPLWHHEQTVATFTLYDSGTMDAIPGQPDGVSKLCLSCHDNTVALDSWGGFSGSLHMGGHKIILGTNLANDHPVSFRYDDALATADGSLHAPSSTSSGLGGTILADLLDNDSKVQCTSCHDIHNREGNGNYRGPRFGLLWIRNDGSSLCLICHDK